MEQCKISFDQSREDLASTEEEKWVLNGLALKEKGNHSQLKVAPGICAVGLPSVEVHDNALSEEKTCIKRAPIILIAQDQSQITCLKRSLEKRIFNPDIWEFGEQYLTHPGSFLTPRGVYVLLYDVSRNLYHTANPLQKQGVFMTKKDSFSQKTNSDFLDECMDSVASLACEVGEDLNPNVKLMPSKFPPVFLVCTTGDETHDSGDPDALASEIFGFLQSKPHRDHLFQRFFVIDKSGRESSEVIEQICTVSKELYVFQMKEAMTPDKLLKFGKALQDMKEKGHKWIKLQEAKQVAHEMCNIDNEEDMLFFLKTLHKQRIVIHFDDPPELNELVVLDLHWLSGVFKKVSTVKRFVHMTHEERKLEELWLKLEKGILEETLLQHILGSLFAECKETADGITEIMKKFSLLCPLPSVNPTCSKRYLVPSLLMAHPSEPIFEMLGSAKIPSLFLKSESGRIPADWFLQLAVKFYQWCSKEFPSQVQPHLFQNFARFYIFPDEGISVVLLFHSSSVEVVVLSPNSLQSKVNLPADLANVVRVQLPSMVNCVQNEVCWLKEVKYEFSFLCPVCCERGARKHCKEHNSEGCTQEECLHFLPESELIRSIGDNIVCRKSATAREEMVQVKQFTPWFAFVEEKQPKDIKECCGKLMPFVEEQQEKSLALPDGILSSLQSQSCNPKNLVGQLEKSLQLTFSSLMVPEPKTKRYIRCLARQAKSSNKIEVVEYLRKVTPAGTTGPLLNELMPVRNIPLQKRAEVAVHLCGGEEWKYVAEKLGFSEPYIRCLHNRYNNPFEVAIQNCHSTVGELYDILDECGYPVFADLL